MEDKIYFLERKMLEFLDRLNLLEAWTKQHETEGLEYGNEIEANMSSTDNRIQAIATQTLNRITGFDGVLIQVTQRLGRLEQALENYPNLERARNLIMEGAQTHASILRCEAKYKELETFFVQQRDCLNDRLSAVEQMQKDFINMPNIIWRKYNKTPYKCPVCDGEGDIKKEIHPKIAEFEKLPTCLAISCKACEGKGILWA